MPHCHSNRDFFFPSLVTYLIHSVTRLQGRVVNMGVRACLYAYVYAAVHLLKLLVNESVFGCIRTVSCPEALHVLSEKDLKCYVAFSQEWIPYNLIPQHGFLDQELHLYCLPFFLVGSRYHHNRDISHWTAHCEFHRVKCIPLTT